MIDVWIRELRRCLSEYLDRAGRPKAVDRVTARARIEDGIRAGWITPGTGSALGPVHRSKASRRVLDVLAEDRGA